MHAELVVTPETPPATYSPWGRLATLVLLVVGLVACQSPPVGESSAPVQDATPPPSEAPEVTEEDDETFTEDDTFIIAGAGDVLIHNRIFEAAEKLAEEDGADEDYDFMPLMTEVEPWIAGADLALCALEVPVAPAGQDPSGYPQFAAPVQIVDALAEIGFDGCSTANNHSMDAGTEGIERTLDVFDDHGIGHVGTARAEDEAEEAQFYTLTRGDSELSVAHLATTQLHNIDPPSDASWMVTDETAEQLSDRAAQARDDGADIVVVSVHWGEEYTHEPNEAQQTYGEELAAGGEIDLVLGSHPHTPQPLEQLDGGPHDDGMWVAWSMGNFFTNQDADCCTMETATGAMVYATIKAPEDEPAQVTEVEWSPVTVDRSKEGYQGIFSLAELVEAEQLPEEVELDSETIGDRWDRAVEVMGEEHLRTEAPEAGDPEDPVVEPRGQ